MNKIHRICRFAMCLVCIATVAGTMTACGDDEPENDRESVSHGLIYDRLAGTTWSLEKTMVKYSDGSEYDMTARYPDAVGETITFSTEKYEYFGGNSSYRLYCSYFPGTYFCWLEGKAGDGYDVFFTSNHGDGSSAGRFYAIFGSGGMSVVLKGDKMTLTSDNKEYVYRKTDGTSGGGNGSGETGGSDKTEEPEVDYYDYTQIGKSSVKVEYVIYNKDESGVTSAQIKYGKTSAASSSASTNISGRYITATISGLSANTDYYVKCVVKYKGGSYTTPATRIRIGEW